MYHITHFIKVWPNGKLVVVDIVVVHVAIVVHIERIVRIVRIARNYHKITLLLILLDLHHY